MATEGSGIALIPFSGGVILKEMGVKLLSGGGLHEFSTTARHFPHDEYVSLDSMARSLGG